MKTGIRGMILAAGIGAFSIPDSSAAALPDLTVSNITFVRGAYKGPCNDVRVTVRNSQVVGVSNPFYVRLSVFADPESEFTNYDKHLSNGIGPGASLPVNFTGVNYLDLPVKAIADSRNQVRESVETNNSRDYKPSNLQECPRLSINDVSVNEGGPATFTVTLDKSFIRPVTVFYKTVDGTARGGSSCTGLTTPDYTSASRGYVRFNPGQTSKTISIATCADNTVRETTETFRVQLYNASNATIRDGSGTGSITLRSIKR